MKNFLALLAIWLALPVFAQAPKPADPTSQPATTMPSFSISASALNLSGTATSQPAADVGASLQLTNSFWLRSDNIVANGYVGNFGGVLYPLPAKLMNKTKLNSASFQPYLTGSFGLSRISTDKSPINHTSGLVGGGLNYDPTGKGAFSVNLVEVRYAKLPGFNNSTVIVSSGLQLGWHW